MNVTYFREYDIEIDEIKHKVHPLEEYDQEALQDSPRYDKYGGYNGYDDDVIDSAYEGDPMATWNTE